MKISKLDEILKKAEQEAALSHKEVISLLSITTQNDLDRIMLVARKLRERYFQNKVFLYGFIYFSTYCRNDCTFCLYRKSNQSVLRYRKKCEEIISAAHGLIDSGVHLIDLTMGEDPQYHTTQDGFRELVQMVRELKQETEIPIMLSPGLVSPEVLGEFMEAGADWYACYQETHNPSLYSRLRLGQDYEERMESKKAARSRGYLIEEGLLAGLGDSTGDIVDSLFVMKKMGADQVRVMTFVPQNNTPLAGWEVHSHFRELLIIAVMRLVMPDRLIPASLDVEGIKGLGQRLHAGANVITSIIPPSSGMAGVSQSSLDIDEGNRTVEKIIPVLRLNHLEPATQGEYQSWIRSRHMFLTNQKREGVKCG